MEAKKIILVRATERDTLRRAAFGRHITMGLRLRGDPGKYMSAPELPALEAA